MQNGSILTLLANTDPVRAENYQDAMLQARERMQREQDRRATENQQKQEEVSDVMMTSCHINYAVEVSCMGERVAYIGCHICLEVELENHDNNKMEVDHLLILGLQPFCRLKLCNEAWERGSFQSVLSCFLNAA